jgi:hypothetical protein
MGTAPGDTGGDDMTADRFSPIADDDPDGPSRLRQGVAILFVLLFTVFLFEAMDGVQRAAEQAERRENALRAACRNPAWAYDADQEDTRVPVEITTTTAAAIPVAATDIPATDVAAIHPPATNPVSGPVSPAQFTPDDPPAPH